MEYEPDKWIVVSVKNPDNKVHYRVFGMWYGNFTTGNSWRLNSGITSVEKEGEFYKFSGSSGSAYYCHKDKYGLSGYGSSVLASIEHSRHRDGVSVSTLPENTEWFNIDWTPNE